MHNNEFVYKLYQREDELIKICLYHGIPQLQVQDIIQEVYLKLLKFKYIDKYLSEGEPNMYIIFAIVRNVIYDYRKRNNKFITVEINDYMDLMPEEEPHENVEEVDIMYELLDEWLKPKNKNKYILDMVLRYDFLKNEIDKVSYWFDRTIIELYIYNNHSVASLAKETTISQSLIKNIIVDFRKKCLIELENQKSNK
jgi:RNA polymerase sigma factor (sigma-70 family)